ncbi:hypothetical protein [Tateyamaria sp.]|uniref:hypothetical protein n=1 Tax=Tateyamaria sp. TaxID=1929288 RepID=UPI0032A084E4
MGKSPKIIDCFTFFNELDVLELRLKTHSPVVDQFVLVESRQTFQGNEKPCYYEENVARFAEFSDKITHIIVEKFAETSDSWHREAEQRNYMNAVVNEFEDTDIILLSDVDELVRPECLLKLKEDPPKDNEVVCFSLQYCFYFLNLVYFEPWQRLGPRAVIKKTFPGMQNLRNIRGPIENRRRDFVRALRAAKRMGRFVKRRLVKNAGWHFAWIGGKDAAAAKILAISTHSRMRNRSSDELVSDILTQRNAAISGGDNFKVMPIDDSFPLEIQENYENWSSFILTEEKKSEELPCL